MNNSTSDFVEFCPFGGTSNFHVLHFPSEAKLSQIISCVANCIVMIPTILLNGISILTIFKTSYLKSKACYLLILIQSTADLAVGVVSLPLSTILRVKELGGSGNCFVNIIFTTLLLLFNQLSIGALSVLTFDRYMGIVHPLTHRVHMTRRKILKYVCYVSLPVLFLPFVRITSETLYLGLAAGYSFTALVFNTFAYTRIFFEVRKINLANGNFRSAAEGHNSSNMDEKKRFLPQLQLMKSCALVVFVSYICYIPYPVCYMYYTRVIDNPLLLRVSTTWCITIGALNASLNSIIFFWKRPLLRIEAYKILKKVFFSEIMF